MGGEREGEGEEYLWFGFFDEKEKTSLKSFNLGSHEEWGGNEEAGDEIRDVVREILLMSYRAIQSP